MHLTWNFTFFCEVCKFGSGGVFQWGYQPCVSVQTVADTMYITRKVFQDSTAQKSVVENFFASFKILSVTKKEIAKAFNSPMTDFEDALQAYCAKKANAKLIITRNIKDYKNSSVKVVTPEEFLLRLP